MLFRRGFCNINSQPMGMEDTADFSRRNMAIDMLRALTMTLMIFVNDLVNVFGVPKWMMHAGVTEDFMGLSDIVFPSFLFAMGMSIPYAVERRLSRGESQIGVLGHILMRTLTLILMGVFIVNAESGLSPDMPLSHGVYWLLLLVGFALVWNSYSKDGNATLHNVLRIIGSLLLLYLALIYKGTDGGVFRSQWWGILGLIGWAYLICAVVYLFCRDNLVLLFSVLGSFILICILVTPMRSGQSLLNWPQPNFLESMLSTLHLRNGCLASFALGGIILSVISAKSESTPAGKRLLTATVASIILVILGIIAHVWWIVSKEQETLPWLMWVGAICVFTYSLLRLLEDKQKTKWFGLIRPAGTSTLTVYLIPYLLYTLRSFTSLTTPSWLTGIVGIGKCFLFALVCIWLAELLGKLGIRLKI